MKASSLIILFFISRLAIAEGATMDTSSFAFPSLEANSGQALNMGLRAAARDGRFKEVERLLHEGADPNASGDYGETALGNAARYNQVLAAKVLLENGANPLLADYHNRTPLMQAAADCSPRIVEMLLKARADVNTRDLFGKTALILAAQDGCLLVSEQLLAAPGIEVNIADDSGRTALDYVSEEMITEVGGPYTKIESLLKSLGAKNQDFTPVEKTRLP